MHILASDTEKAEGIAGSDGPICINCKKKPAEIFQINGEFCLECWQAITHTNA